MRDTAGIAEEGRALLGKPHDDQVRGRSVACCVPCVSTRDKMHSCFALLFACHTRAGAWRYRQRGSWAVSTARAAMVVPPGLVKPVHQADALGEYHTSTCSTNMI
jgi:hypothetical protein